MPEISIFYAENNPHTLVTSEINDDDIVLCYSMMDAYAFFLINLFLVCISIAMNLFQLVLKRIY